LTGLTLEEIKNTIDERLSGVAANGNNSLIQIIVQSSNKLFSFEDQKNLHLGGTHNIVSNPEFSDRQFTLKILQLIESKKSILHHFNELTDENITISIGEENKEDLFRNCSIISARYHIGNVSGTLGVVGPTRIQYAKIISLVDYMGKVLTQKLGSRLS
ncbi:MAG: HrcA family transcriptional regulator, partial [bacterium]